MRAAVADALQRFGVAGAVDEIVVTGGSAGGLSTTLHVDRLRDLMGAQTAAGMPQCGYFPAYNASCGESSSHWPTTCTYPRSEHAPCAEGPSPSIWCNATDQFRATFTMQNASGAMAPQCLEDNAAEPWRCFLAPVATPYVEAPLFIWCACASYVWLPLLVDRLAPHAGSPSSTISSFPPSVTSSALSLRRIIPPGSRT